MQFSQSPSAANGGHLGWVLKGKLPAPLENAAFRLKEGAVSDPVVFGNDYYIFKMEKIFNPKTDAKSLPDRKQVKAYLENKKLEEFSTKYIKDLRNRALIEKKI
jgi:parvulin-like peptidyl-prolyl isomerase